MKRRTRAVISLAAPALACELTYCISVYSVYNRTMPKRYSSRELQRIVEADGWVLKSIEGSHHHYTHPTKKGKVTIVHPEKVIHPKTAKSILTQAGLI